MPFDVDSALQGGMTEGQVLGYLKSSRSPNYDINGALNAGMSNRQIIDYLAPKPPLGQASTSPKTTVPGMEQLGGTPPGPRPRPVVPGLDTPGVSIPMRNSQGYIGQPRGLDQPMGPVATALTTPLGWTVNAAGQIGRGVQRIQDRQPGSGGSEIAGGVSDIVRGGGALALPFVAPALLARPVASAIGLGVGTGVGAGTEAGLKGLGVSPGYSEAAGTATGLATGALATAGAQRFGPNLLARKAAQNYLTALKTPNTDPAVVGQYEKTAAQMTQPGNRPIATGQGLARQAAQEVQTRGPQVKTAYAGAAPADPQPIYDRIEDLRSKMATQPNPAGPGAPPIVTNPAANKALNFVKSTLDQLRDPATGKIDPKVLHDYSEQLFNGGVDPKGNLRASSPDTAAALENGIAGSIKDVLDTANPSAKQINETYSMWKTIGRAMRDQAVKQLVSESNLGTSQGAGAYMKAMTPRVFRTLSKGPAAIFDSVAWNTVSGATKAWLAQLLAGGQYPEAVAIMNQAPTRASLPPISTGPRTPAPPAPGAAPQGAAPAPAGPPVPVGVAPPGRVPRGTILRSRNLVWPPPNAGSNWTGTGGVP